MAEGIAKGVEVLREDGSLHLDGMARWFLVFGRNRDGSIRNQQEITELLEGAFQGALRDVRDRFYDQVQERDKRIEDLMGIVHEANLRNEETVRFWEAERDAKVLETKMDCLSANQAIVEAIETKLKKTEAAYSRDRQRWGETVNSQVERVRDLETVLRPNLESLAAYAHESIVKSRRLEGHHLRSERPWWHFWCPRCDKSLIPWDELSYLQQDAYLGIIAPVLALQRQLARVEETDELDGESETVQERVAV